MDNVEKLIMDGEYIQDLVKATIFELTKENPLVLFEMNEENDPMIKGELCDIDDLLELPWCDYTEDTYYCMATVQKVEGGGITILLQNDDTFYKPQFESLPLSSLDFQQQIEVLKLLKNR